MQYTVVKQKEIALWEHSLLQVFQELHELSDYKIKVCFTSDTHAAKLIVELGEAIVAIQFVKSQCEKPELNLVPSQLNDVCSML